MSNINKENDNIIYGNALKNLRLKNHLTQEQVAQLTGFDTKYISQMETGRYMGTIKTMLKFCVALNVTPNDILFDFIKETTINNDINKFSTNFSKLSSKDKKNVLALIDSMLSD
ncbi:MAG: helix-turn-helix transcriptional regulator [Clostridia bacterium]|nr:helix-turn-helix transcriptional regulator [Clostridia bacterium]